ALMHTRPIERLPTTDRAVRRIVACGSSPLVTYEGTGMYHVEVNADTAEVLIQPDARFVRPPWDRQRQKPWERICELDWNASHRFVLHLPGWNEGVTVHRVEAGRAVPVATQGPGADFQARPGRYRLTRGAP
ncbi:MAG: hypothetical protein QHJ73_09180, partial [Armatimonadota bacterium]|nr:hypothetical protein [Armatimonadota bacterium]